MSPEIVIDRVQSFLRWNSDRLDALDEDHDPIANPACYRRGEREKREYWITAATWRDVLFVGGANEALEAARILCDAGLLRPLDHANLQVCAKIRGKVTKVYALRSEIVTWKVTAEAPRGNGGHGHAGLGLTGPRTTVVSPSPALVPLPAGAQPDAPGLATKLENVVSLALDEAESILRVQVSPDDRAYQAVLRAKTAIFNGALANQVRVDEVKFQAREDKGGLKHLLQVAEEVQRELDADQAQKDKEDARRARDAGMCDDTLSDKIAAEIYREKTRPWRTKPDRPPADR
jgi:hypothetical protein